MDQEVNEIPRHLSKRSLFLVGALVIAALAIVYAVWYGFGRKADQRNSNFTVERQEVITDRAVLLNILNQFHLRIQAGESDETLAADVQETLTRLRSVQPGETVVPARDELIAAFARWDQAIAENGDTRSVRDELKRIAAAYPWLDAMLWIIISKRL